MESSGNIRRSTLERFGNYCLLYPLAYGGMAAIYLARTMTAGVGRLLVVKRILPQIASDPMFLNMFRAEIRVCLELTHPNIVQVYDFGDFDGQPYIAMEYVEGKNLRELVERMAEQHKQVPVGIATTIIAQAASALHHAHTARNRVTGEPLGIIHRDVTPHNILVSYSGNSKVIDFGVAKAVVDDAEKTRAGGIKGKVRYLSPEQIQGEILDHRSDIFSLGIVLWEALTGRQLFGGASEGAAARSGSGAARDFEIMKEIVGCSGRIVPPSRFNADISPELDRITLKALHADRDQRYQTAEDLHEDLRRFLNVAMPGVSERAVGDLMQATFAERIKIERDATRDFGARAQQLVESGTPPPMTSTTRASASRVIVAPPNFSSQNRGTGQSRTPGQVAPPSYNANHGQGSNYDPNYGQGFGGPDRSRGNSTVPSGDRTGRTNGTQPSYRPPTASMPAAKSISRQGLPPSPPQALPTIPSEIGTRGTRVGLKATTVMTARKRRGPQFIIYATAATAFWSFAIWLSVQHRAPIELMRRPAEAIAHAIKAEMPSQKIRLALNSPAEAAAAVPAAKPVANDDNVSVLKSLVNDPLREVRSVVLRIAVEPKSSVPTRVLVNGTWLQDSDQTVPIELGKNVALRVERPSFIPFEDHVTVTRKDVDRFGVARLTVHLSEW